MTPNCSPVPLQSLHQLNQQKQKLKHSFTEEFLFVLDLTCSFRFEAKREIIKTDVVLPILQYKIILNITFSYFLLIILKEIYIKK